MVKGSYEEIIGELNQLGRDCLSLGNETKACKIARAFNAVEGGEDEVRLGDFLYVVEGGRRAPVA